MTFFATLVIVAVFIFLLILNSFIRKYIKQNNEEVKKLHKSLNDIKRTLKIPEVKDIKTPPQKTEKEVSVTQPLKVKEEIKTDKQVPVSLKIKSPTYKPKTKPPIKSKSFLEKHPDLEKFIGENLINKIGIAILVLGIGFLVKYAIDKNWINEIGRVAIGILSAGGLIGLAHKLRKNYKSFSSVLIGGGLALLYFTITLAFQLKGYPLYQQQTVTFIILTFITIFAVFLSIVYNRIEIAILAILGGFGSPFMVSNGSDNYIILFSYLMLLDIGMLVLSYYKKWRLVNIVSFACTVLLFTIWLIFELNEEQYTAFIGAIFFVTGFYIIFFLMNLIYNIKRNISFKIGDILLILSNTFIYFSFVMIMLSHIEGHNYKGLFAILLGVFNFGFAYFIHKRKKTNTNLLYLLIGLVFTFITLSIPLQLKGNYITLFWSVESLLLLWLSQKSSFKVLKLGSLLVGILMLISLIKVWGDNYYIVAYTSEVYFKQLGFLINKMTITTLVSGVSLILTITLLKKEKGNIAWVIPVNVYKSMVFVLVIVVFYVGGLLEVSYQSYHFFSENSSLAVAAYTYNALTVLILLIIAHVLKNRNFSIVISVLSTIFVIAFILGLSNYYAKIILNNEVYSTTLLVFRWISIFAVYTISILLFKLVNKLIGKLKNEIYKYNVFLLIFTFIYLLSADLDSIAVLISKNKDILYHTQKIGYAILWGVCSFIIMIIGRRRKEKLFRIFSLVLFAITIIKLFVYDISNISDGGKIVAFILLGILLLIVSFMYQKVKRLVVDDSSKENNKEKESITSKD